MTISNKNKFILFGAIGLLRHLLNKQLISIHIYQEFLQIIHFEDNNIFFSNKRGRKKIDISFINELLPDIRDDSTIDTQDDALNLFFITEQLLLQQGTQSLET